MQIYFNPTLFTFFILCFSYHQLAFPIGITEPEFRSAAHCDSIKDYEQSKQGTLRIGMPVLSIKNTNLTIKTQVIGSQCTKLKDNRYQWKTVNPYGKIHYQHHRLDSKKQTLQMDTITIERKKTWLSAINRTLTLVGKGDVSGTTSTGFYASITFPIAKLFDSSQLEALHSGKSQDIKVGLFLKSLIRYIIDETPTAYEETNGLGLYDINFTLRKVKGNIVIVK
ncbi:MAG: hypothetical protein ACI9D5_001967 [Candidatus Endobugula sp.]|jgi:hypothetical protein